MRSLGIRSNAEYEQYKTEKAHREQDRAYKLAVSPGLRVAPKKLKTESRSKGFSVACMPGAALLSDVEKKLCEALKCVPPSFLPKHASFFSLLNYMLHSVSPQQYFVLKEAIIRRAESTGGVSHAKARRITKLGKSPIRPLLPVLHVSLCLLQNRLCKDHDASRAPRIVQAHQGCCLTTTDAGIAPNRSCLWRHRRASSQAPP